MRFTFVVEIEINRQQGKFASREDIAQELQDALDQANPSDLQVGDGSEYTVDDWSVEEQPQEKRKKVKKPNVETKKALQDTEQGTNLVRADSVDALVKDLGS